MRHRYRHMQVPHIICGGFNKEETENALIDLGTFDGVHFGHKIIIDRLKEIAQKQKGETWSYS